VRVQEVRQVPRTARGFRPGGIFGTYRRPEVVDD
jgi:hypothetical protein